MRSFPLYCASFGSYEVWDHFLNRYDPVGEYAHVRNLNTGWVLSGWISMFSEKSSRRELVLRSVQLRDEDGEQRGDEVSYVYVSLDDGSYQIEFPNMEGAKNG